MLSYVRTVVVFGMLPKQKMRNWEQENKKMGAKRRKDDRDSGISRDWVKFYSHFIFPFPVPSLPLPFFVSIVKILVSPHFSCESYLTLNVYFVLSRLALKFGWYDNKSRVAQEIKGTLTCSTLFCTFLCRCCRNVKLPSYTFYGENVVCVPKKNLLIVFLFAFFFTSLIFTLLGTGIPHFFSFFISVALFLLELR